jgi:hypothetical protein
LCRKILTLGMISGPFLRSYYSIFFKLWRHCTDPQSNSVKIQRLAADSASNDPNLETKK